MSFLLRARNRGIAWLATAIPAYGRHLAAKYQARRTEGIPWAPLRTPLARCTVALVTTSGVHRRDQQPYDMHDPDGDPDFRELPGDAPLSALMITHDYYDHADADRDLNIVFPLERLRELAAAGEIGAVAPRHFGLMGHVTGRHIDTLVRSTAPRIAALLRKDRVDAVVLTPG